ncbi:hypothetical protein KVR01_012767 [Diaporthe batatas]|uniref:uncharacterized protein n=1 Tax=Diaporthe batatas TaxID=748121 RepID=UPI001D059596|nr:uncharacterized protein KVR01_012767 [Diaporthe batatas]KAG8157383.1 hypothetical protein KVR01_012767 [Diaporthe batatas]
MPNTAAKNFDLRSATCEDATRIAEIHMAAFKDNAMLHAQFPTPAIRKLLQTCSEDKALADINDPKITVLVVTTTDSNDEEVVIAFAKWSYPIFPGDDYVESPWIWPDGTDLDTLRAWTAKAEEAESRSVGETPCYRLTFIGTDPVYSRRGAGQILVQWGIQQSKARGLPLYLESTVEAAPFYKKHEFSTRESILLPICVDGGEKTQIYEEIVFTYGRV